MKAVTIRRFGPAADVLELVADAPRPAAGQSQILVRVHATSVNPIDCAVRAGYGSEFFKARGLIRMPLIPGRDVAGTVEDIGARNVEFVRGLGADPVVDYEKQKLDDVLRDYDAVLDTTFDREEELLAALKTHADAVYVSIVTPKIRLVDQLGVTEGLRRGDELL